MEDEFEVYRVLDRKMVGGHIFYHIQWKHFLPKYNTWEPENNLHCDQMVKRFEEKRVEKIIGKYDNFVRV